MADLCVASARGQVDEARRIIQAAADASAIINHRDKDGNCPLIIAANGKQDLLEELLGVTGRDLEVKDNDGMTPLLIACSMDGNLACLKMLVEAGASLTAKDGTGNGWEFWCKGQDDKEAYCTAQQETALVKTGKTGGGDGGGCCLVS